MAIITQSEAKRQNLSGHDVFKRTQLCYHDDLNRDHFVLTLNKEALKIFSLSVMLGQHAELKKEAQKVKDQLQDGTFNLATHQISNNTIKLLEYINLEFFYIATGFELYFKSWLLQNDFIVNIIDNEPQFRNLKKDQKDRPIKKAEFFSLGSFQYDTIKEKNILQGISEQSLGFNTICNKSQYSNALNVSIDVLGLVDDYRNLRNQIHLPGDFCEMPTISRLGGNATEILINFINERIVKNSNIIIQQRQLKIAELQTI